jgi:hypothetical protein
MLLTKKIHTLKIEEPKDSKDDNSLGSIVIDHLMNVIINRSDIGP